MSKSPSGGVQRGQTIAFRIPSDTPDHIVKQLQKLKETERRNFSGKIAEYVIKGVGQSMSQERETLSIPLPQKLTKVQRDWLKHEHSEALLGSIIYQLISDPVRSTSLLAALNSNATDIDQALYLQEDPLGGNAGLKNFVPESIEHKNPIFADNDSSEGMLQDHFDRLEDDLADFNWEDAKRDSQWEDSKESKEEEDLDSLLGGFLAQMNK